MRALFVGYGSMAKRHISNLESMSRERGENLTVDLWRHELSSSPKEVRNIYTSFDDIDVSYDAVFITNPTSFHYEALVRALAFSDCFFLEKPAFDSLDYDLSPFASKTVYVACPLRYTGIISWLHDNYDFRNARSLRALSSSYLPEWRPGIDYRQTYSASKQQGGGVSIDLIHEWDYIQYLIGYPQEILSIIDKKSDLQIDCDDVALYIASYANMVAELHLDYFGRVPLRTLEIFDESDTIVCDFLKSEIVWLGSQRRLAFEETRDDFQKRELEHFFDIVNGKSVNDNSLDRAVRTLALAKGIIK